MFTLYFLECIRIVVYEAPVPCPWDLVSYSRDLCLIGFAGQVEQEKRKAAAKAAAEYRKAKENQGWVGWLMGGAGLVGGGPPPAADEHGLRGDLNQEEYQKLEEIVSEQEAAVKQGECHCCIEQLTTANPRPRALSPVPSLAFW